MLQIWMQPPEKEMKKNVIVSNLLMFPLTMRDAKDICLFNLQVWMRARKQRTGGFWRLADTTGWPNRQASLVLRHIIFVLLALFICHTLSEAEIYHSTLFGHHAVNVRLTCINVVARAISLLVTVLPDWYK